jgi:cation diffusion facilitator CzcD-associated flavoprotein CzcO
MAYSDMPFPYGPFVPHHVPRQYIENYFAAHGIDSTLQTDTTVEDLSKIPAAEPGHPDRWKLTLRKFDPAQSLDVWWEEQFDAVILANGHYTVPYASFTLFPRTLTSIN